MHVTEVEGKRAHEYPGGQDGVEIRVECRACLNLHPQPSLYLQLVITWALPGLSVHAYIVLCHKSIISFIVDTQPSTAFSHPEGSEFSAQVVGGTYQGTQGTPRIYPGYLQGQLSSGPARVQVAEGEHLGLQGKSTVKGRATLSEDPSHANRQHISFQGVAIRPADPHQLDSWLGAFQQANPTMVRALVWTLFR